jgi:hypothetical protein
MGVARQMLHHWAMRLFLFVPLLIALASGCYATTSTGYVGYSGTATVTTVAPDLVYVSPGVQVIADYDEPIFYSDGFYWRESGGIWYRSSVHTGGWVTYSAPRHIVGIRDRHTYRHYRPAGYTPRHRDNRAYDRRAPVTRDNRTYDRRAPVTRDNRTYDRREPAVRDNRARPTTRDHRRHDDKDDRYDHKRDHR